MRYEFIKTLKMTISEGEKDKFFQALGIPLEIFDEFGNDLAPFESSFLYLHEIDHVHESKKKPSYPLRSDL